MAFNAPSKADQSPVDDGGGGRGVLRAVRRDAAAARAALDQLDARLSRALGEPAPPTPGRGPRGGNLRGKLDRDAEVKAFVEERLDSMTYKEIAAAVRAAFGPDRAIGTSTVQRWWKKKFDAAK